MRTETSIDPTAADILNKPLAHITKITRKQCDGFVVCKLTWSDGMRLIVSERDAENASKSNELEITEVTS